MADCVARRRRKPPLGKGKFIMPPIGMEKTIPPIYRGTKCPTIGTKCPPIGTKCPPYTEHRKRLQMAKRTFSGCFGTTAKGGWSKKTDWGNLQKAASGRLGVPWNAKRYIKRLTFRLSGGGRAFPPLEGFELYLLSIRGEKDHTPHLSGDKMSPHPGTKCPPYTEFPSGRREPP